MIAALIAVLHTVLDLADDHPDLSKKLVYEVRDLLQHHSAEAMPTVEALRGISAGMAAARASAIQTALRRAPNPTT